MNDEKEITIKLSKLEIIAHPTDIDKILKYIEYNQIEVEMKLNEKAME